MPPRPGMRAPISQEGLTRLQLLAAAALVLASGGVVWAAIELSPDVAFVRHDEHARWITPPQPARVKGIWVDRTAPPRSLFARDFRLEAVPERALLHVRALRQLELRINGRPVALEGRDPLRWKRETLADVTAHLAPGRNRLEAEVANPEGPPLLYLWLEGPAPRVATGPGWTVARGDTRRPAVVAHDVRSYPQAEFLPTPARMLLEHGPLLVAVFLGCGALAWLRPRWPAFVGGEHWPRTAWLAVCLFWALLFAAKVVHFPLTLGFDGEAQVEYLRFLARERRIPLATEGWSMFHPPLFHVTTALLRGLLGAEEGSLVDGIALHAVPMAAGLACAFVAGRLALRLFPGRHGLAALAVVAAGLMPINVYISAFVSNESLHALLVGLALWIACDALLQPRASAAKLAALAAVLGLALLAKATSALVAPLVLAFVAAKLWLVEARSPARSAGAIAGMLALALALGGWFYARNWLLLGKPFLTNYNLPTDWTYWLIPGFHTASWYLGFGEVLAHPFFAGFASYWDGLYSTFWGDGSASGRAGLKYPNPWWNYDYMTAAYALALPATAIGLIGFGVCAARALRGPELGRRLGLSLLLTVAYAMALTLLLMTFRYPHYGLPKAFYGLPALAPLALAFAAGFAQVDAWLGRWGGRPARALLYGSSGALAAAIALGFLT